MDISIQGTTRIPPSGRVLALRSWVRWFLFSPRVLISGGFILILLFVAVAAPLLTNADPNLIRTGKQFLGPGQSSWIGTDEFGRDILARLLFGTRISLAVSVGSVIIAVTLGTLMGMAAAFFGHPLDMVLMRLTDAILSFPAILLAIFVITFAGASLVNLIIVIGLLYIPRFARVAYSATLSIQENDYIEASRAIGAGSTRILLRGILPNIIAPLLVQISLSMGTAILLESSLSFLGLAPPTVASWGRSIQQSSRFMGQHPWGVIWPSIVISAAVLSFNILGDALRDRLDPRVRK